MKKSLPTICVIGGDGIGPEVIGETLRVLWASGFKFRAIEAEAGFSTYEKYGTSLPEKTIKKVEDSMVVLFGAVTSPPNMEGYKSPIVTLRKQFNLYANLRPFEPLPGIKAEKTLNIILVRENSEDLYTGREHEIQDGVVAERVITRTASERITRFAFELAVRKRRSKVAIVHKANVLRKSDGLFLSVAKRVAAEFSQIKCDDVLVDSCAMQLIKAPHLFDIIVTTNMFGDILSDEIAALNGGLGVAPSANIGESLALFEPVHGSAPKYVGMNRANPLASMLSACMMLDFLKEEQLATHIRAALYETLKQGVKTVDVGGLATMTEFTDAVIKNLI